MIQKDNSEKNLAAKMDSDKKLLKYKEEMMIATENLRQNKFQYVGAALVITYKNRASLVACGFDHSGNYADPSYFLFSTLIDRYRNDYDFLDLGGLASNFNPTSKYAKFNEEKLAFKPTIYEYIGELDLVINENAFRRIQSKGILSKEFNASHKFN
jgi:lipid II:glycine glycyltransferase (peptidoglycan interpeptide bridge formation enzyme)